MKEIKTFLVGFATAAIGVAVFAGGVYTYIWLTSSSTGKAVIDVFVIVIGTFLIVVLIYALGRIIREF